MNAAPFFAEDAKGPPEAVPVWLTTADGVRLRAVHWRGGDKGTVILLPGRTEYVEKYGPAAIDLAARGYGTVTIDWRGQGLSDRPLADAMVGHVRHFSEYQQDLTALLAQLDAWGLAGPRYMIAHSMGGSIGLRALTRGFPVRAAVFSAPMWGIRLSPATRPLAHALSTLARHTGLAHRYAPGTGPSTYVADAEVAGNVLTTDPEMFAFMKHQVTAHPELALGGPSLGWLHAALAECRALAMLPSPDVPTLTFVGTSERVVDLLAVERRMARWPSGALDVVDGAEHEVLMETPATRARFFDAAAALFDAHR